MRDHHLSLHEIQARVEAGDAAAVPELRRRLQPILAGIVRRMMCAPGERSWLMSLVQAEIRRVHQRGFDEKMAEDRSLVAHIVARIAGTVIQQLRIGIHPLPTYLETIRNWSARSLPLEPRDLAISSPPNNREIHENTHYRRSIGQCESFENGLGSVGI